MRAGWIRAALAALAVLGLSACDPGWLQPAPPGTKPQVRPDGLRPAPLKPQPVPKGPSAASLELAGYYNRVQAELVSRGLMRTDGGGPDTPFTDTMLARNFEAIALADEYIPGQGFAQNDGGDAPIRKWQRPVRVEAEFGRSVPAAQRSRDGAQLASYVARLARVSGHPMSMVGSDANFHVLFMGEDDRAQLVSRVRALVPGLNASSLSVFQNLPRDVHCLVIAFSDAPGGYAYGRAIALIRAEHPDLLRRSCIHEEMAQGLGLGNDSPAARPSIFNDDDEFALLTTHDEMLLRILYSPRLTPGMTAATARPIVRDLAAQMLGGPS